MHMVGRRELHSMGPEFKKDLECREVLLECRDKKRGAFW